MCVKIDGEDKIIHGTLVLVLGDNLASHYLGGYTKNPSSALTKCRYCMPTYDDMKSKVCLYVLFDDLSIICVL